MYVSMHVARFVPVQTTSWAREHRPPEMAFDWSAWEMTKYYCGMFERRLAQVVRYLFVLRCRLL